MTQPRRYIAVADGFLMVLRQGDDVFASLEALMRDERIASASIRGFGFVRTARFGYFDFARGDYDPREFSDLDIIGLTGTLAWKNAKPAVHAHATGAGRDFTAVGGHVLGLVVGRGSFEMTVNVYNQRLERRFEDDIGANVLQLG
jgi:uncharacterized protein